MPSEHAAGGRARRAARLRQWIASAIELAILLYAAAIVLILLTGGIDLGWISMREAAKPILILWILVPIRLAIGRPSWFGGRWLGPALTRVGTMLRSLAARAPAAVRDAAFVFLITRLTLLTVAFLVNLLLTSNRVRPFTMPFERTKLAEVFAAWDSAWYFDIAARGYSFAPDAQSSVAFFPLYPMAMRALAWPFGSSPAAIWAAGVAISSVSFFFGLVALHRFTDDVFHEREVARRALLYVAIYPFSFFMSVVYPSALYFLLAVLAVGAAYRSRWWVAGLCGALATLARPHGIVLSVPLGLLALRGGGWRTVAGRAIQLAPIPAAFLAYSIYVQSLAGDPLAWLSSQQQWGFSLGHPPWEQLLGTLARLERHGFYDYFFTSSTAAFRAFHGAAALFLLALTPFVFTRLGAPLGCWVLLSVAIPLSGNALEGIGRYGAALFPVFMILASFRSPRLHEALLIAWSLFLALFVALFVTWQPIY